MNSYRAGDKIWEVGFLSGYNLCIFIGIILAFATAAYHWRRQKYSWENLQILMIIMIPCAIFGARFYTLIFDAQNGDSWSHFFEFRGLSIYGGVLGAVIPGAIYMYFRRYSMDFRTVLTLVLPTVLLGQALGRWGNFQNHEVYGQIVSNGSSLDWMGGLKEHMNIYTYDDPTPHLRQPLFFYESMMCLFGYFVLCWGMNDRNTLFAYRKGGEWNKVYAKPGVTGALYMVWYGIVRLALQTLRDGSVQNTSYFTTAKVVPVNLVVSSIVIFFGVFLALWWQFQPSFSIKFKYRKSGEIVIGPKTKYTMIHPSKEVRRFWVGKKYERTFNIWVVDVEPKQKWSKRDLNRGNRKSRRA